MPAHSRATAAIVRIVATNLRSDQAIMTHEQTDNAVVMVGMTRRTIRYVALPHFFPIVAFQNRIRSGASPFTCFALVARSLSSFALARTNKKKGLWK